MLRLILILLISYSAVTPAIANDSIWQRFKGSFQKKQQEDPFYNPSLSAIEREQRRSANEKLSKNLGIDVPDGFDPNLLSANAKPKTFEELKMIRKIKNAQGNKEVEKRRDELKAERLAEQRKQQQRLQRQQQGIRTYSYGGNKPIYRQQKVNPNRAVPVYRPGERSWSQTR